ncbi:hypothetical protein LCGC14_3006970, partial [marine sediment metagenome]
GIARDITERKWAEEALKESEEKFRALFDYASDSILLMKLGDGGAPVIVDVNAATCEMHGYSKEELIGQPISMLDDPETTEQVLERARRVLAGESLTFEGRHVRKDGTVFPVEVSTCMFNIGKDKYIIGIDRDITERKKADEVLKEAQRLVAEKSAYLDSILQSSTDMAIAATNLDYVIMYYNPMAEKVFGYKADEVLGKTVIEMHTKEKVDHSRFEKAVEIVKKEGFYKYFVKKELKDGTQTFESIVSGIRDKNGELVGFVLMSRDITEQLRVQAESMRTSHLTSIGELAAGVAHEINNPINGIINYARLISRKRKEGDREFEIAERITKEGNRIADIVSSLLSFARGDIKEKKSTNLYGVVSD